MALMEVGVRLVNPQPEPARWMEADPVYGHRLKRNFRHDFPFPGTDFVMEVRTNSDGFRDADFKEGDSAQKRVLFLGDSYTFGHGIAVEDRFDRVFKKLKADEGVSVDTINCGVNGWGTAQAVQYGISQLERCQPHAVVLTFCENDVRDDSNFIRHGFSFDQVHFPGKAFFNAHSHLFRLAINQYMMRKKKDSEYITDNNSGLDDAKKKALLWNRSLGYFKSIADELQKHGPECTFYIQATQPADSFYRDHFLGMKEPNIEYIDLEKYLDGLSPEEQVLSYNGHWSGAMHQRSATALADSIQF